MSNAACQSGWRANNRRMLRGVAQHHQRLIAGMNGEDGVAWRVAGRRHRDDTGRNLPGRLVARHLFGDVGENPPLVEEGEFRIRRRRVNLASSIQ